ncbi:putative Ribbon-helix-helix protein, CopG family [Alphaproteobacteria bacterium]
MKKLTNFSFDQKIINLLNELSVKYSLSKTAIVQRAIEEYAHRKLSQKSEILNFAHTISADDANDMMEVIQKSRINKDEA